MVSAALCCAGEGLGGTSCTGDRGRRGGWRVLEESWQRRTCNATPSRDRGDEEAAVIK